MAFGWSDGWTGRWRMFSVDPRTWADVELAARVDSASIDRTRGGLVESASLSITREVGATFDEGYYRIVLIAESGGTRQRADVATLYLMSATTDTDMRIDTSSLEGSSVLYPASVRRLLSGTYAPSGINGAEYAATLLRECTPAPVHVDGAFTLGTHLVFDIGCTYLDAAWEVLDAGGFCIQIDGRGEVHILPMPQEPSLVMSPGDMEPKLVRTLDYSLVPNRYTVYEDGLTATAVNDDPASPTSTESRGFPVDVVDTSPKLLEGESMASYARRKLAEASVLEEEYGYTREWFPNVHPYSIVKAELPAAGAVAALRVDRQSLDCGHGITVSERAVREVVAWQA